MRISDIIFSNTYTYTDFHRRFSLLKEFIEFLLYKDRQKHLPVLDRFDRFCVGKRITDDNKEAVKEWGEDLFKKILSSKDPYDILSEIEDDFKKCPVFFLQTPVEPRSEDVVFIGKWIKKNVDERAFLIFKADCDMAAGCYFSWGDEKYDMSFKSMKKTQYKKISSRIKEIMNENIL